MDLNKMGTGPSVKFKEKHQLHIILDFNTMLVLTVSCSGGNSLSVVDACTLRLRRSTF